MDDSQVVVNFSTLSNREMQIVVLLIRGHGNREIAEELGLSIDTVKTHLKRIFAKLHVNGRTQAAVKAVEAGLAG